MATADPRVIAQIAASAGMPPAILYAVAMQDGVFADTDVAAPGKIQEIADSVAQGFRQYGTWEKALSYYRTGDPNVYQSPTSPDGGWVNGVMGIAGARATYGMQQLDAASLNTDYWSAGASAFSKSISALTALGGVVTQQHAQAWDQASKTAQVSASQAAERRAGGAPSGTVPSGERLSYDKSKMPFEKFEHMPFDAKFMQQESENFGYLWSGWHEQGNDYGLPVGTQVSAPMGGTLEYRHLAGGTGLTAYIKLANGWRIGLGHLSQPIAPAGSQINAGDVLALSGGQPGDPNAGHSSGPHIEFQLIDPQWNYHDPQPLLESTGGTKGSMAPGGMGGGKGEDDEKQTPSNNAMRQSMDPDDVAPRDVETFAQQAQALGLTPDALLQNYSYVAGLRWKMFGEPTRLEDAAPFVHLTKDQILAAVRAQPHPTYPQHTAGAVMDTFDHASLHSLQHIGRMPLMTEVARLVSANSNDAIIKNYYQTLGETENPGQQQPKLRAVQGGAGGDSQPKPEKQHERGSKAS